MRLLVSVRSPGEAAAALQGGADIIDAKDPAAGALGPVSLDTLRGIVAAVGPGCTVSAAIGDAIDQSDLGGSVREFTRAGAAFVKVGFAGSADVGWLASQLDAAVRAAAAAGGQVVAVGYADYREVRSASPRAVADAAAAAGAAGVLLDTAVKTGRDVLRWVGEEGLRRWAEEVHAHGMFTALGGQLTEKALASVGPLAIDIVGVRGAACDRGRTGTISALKVRSLADALRAASRRLPSIAGSAHRHGRSSDRRGNRPTLQPL